MLSRHDSIVLALRAVHLTVRVQSNFRTVCIVQASRSSFPSVVIDGHSLKELRHAAHGDAHRKGAAVHEIQQPAVRVRRRELSCHVDKDCRDDNARQREHLLTGCASPTLRLRDQARTGGTGGEREGEEHESEGEQARREASTREERKLATHLREKVGEGREAVRRREGGVRWREMA